MQHEVTNILLIEDDEDDYVLARSMLSGKPFHVAWVQTLSAALSHLNDQRVDAVLLDLSLLGSPKVDALQAISAQAKQIPIVVLTGLEDEKTAADALQRGAQDYLVKGKITAELIERSLHYSILRKQSENYARRISLFEQREDFVAMLAHDLKNPIIGANRILELFAKGELGGLTDEQKDVVEQMRTSNVRLLGMIHALLDAYRYETAGADMVLKHTDVTKLLTPCLQEFAALARDKKLEIKLAVETGVPQVMAEESSLYRVIQNLLHNAIKFSPEGCAIGVRLHHIADSVVLEVHNDGPLITADDQSRLFERFWQGVPGKKYTAGTGLGLYLCKHIIEAHHGHITCASKQDAGTTFTVKLPAANVAVIPVKTGSTSGTK